MPDKIGVGSSERGGLRHARLREGHSQGLSPGSKASHSTHPIIYTPHSHAQFCLTKCIFNIPLDYNNSNTKLWTKTSSATVLKLRFPPPRPMSLHPVPCINLSCVAPQVLFSFQSFLKEAFILQLCVNYHYYCKINITILGRICY